MKVSKFITIFTILCLSASALSSTTSVTAEDIKAGSCYQACIKVLSASACIKRCSAQVAALVPDISATSVEEIKASGCFNLCLKLLIINACIRRCGGRRLQNNLPVVSTPSVEEIKAGSCYQACIKVLVASACIKRCGGRVQALVPDVSSTAIEEIKASGCFEACIKVLVFNACVRRCSVPGRRRRRRRRRVQAALPTTPSVEEIKASGCWNACIKIFSYEACLNKCGRKLLNESLIKPTIEEIKANAACWNACIKILIFPFCLNKCGRRLQGALPAAPVAPATPTTPSVEEIKASGCWNACIKIFSYEACLNKCGRKLMNALTASISQRRGSDTWRRVKLAVCLKACEHSPDFLRQICDDECKKHFGTPTLQFRKKWKKWRRKARIAIKKKICLAGCTKLGPLAGICIEKCNKKFVKAPTPLTVATPTEEQKADACFGPCFRIWGLIKLCGKYCTRLQAQLPAQKVASAIEEKKAGACIGPCLRIWGLLKFCARYCTRIEAEVNALPEKVTGDWRRKI